jgi:hypothetical protein
MSHFKAPGTCNYEAFFHATVHILHSMASWSWDIVFDGWPSLNMTILTNSLLELLSYFTCIEAIQMILCCMQSGLWNYEVGLSQSVFKMKFSGLPYYTQIQVFLVVNVHKFRMERKDFAVYGVTCGSSQPPFKVCVIYMS